MSNSAPHKTAFIISFPLVFLLIATLFLTGAHFTYTLDDPYIHLTLGRNIWHGHYGVNMNELSAPSSSILWPFLLAPFSVLGPLYQFVPLILNGLFLYLTAWLVVVTFAERSVREQTIIGVSILLSTNAYGLVFNGMEHSLQVLLVSIIAFGILDKLETGKKWSTYRLGRLAIAAVILLPLVRYEGLAISLPVIGYIFQRGDRKAAVIALITISALVGGFSIFLHENGLGWLPTSVMLKSTHHGLALTFSNLVQNLSVYGFLMIPIAVFGRLSWSRDKLVPWVFVIAAILHFLFGQLGWFGRYESYFIIFTLMLTIRVLTQRVTISPFYGLLLPIVFFNLTVPTVMTPLAAANILNQQGQMAELAKVIGEPVAVNDMGFVLFESGQYVLDLYGLASKSVADARATGRYSAAFVDQAMKNKGVRYAMVYNSWVAPIPAHWTKVGSLMLLDQRVTLPEPEVSIYATDDESVRKIEPILVDYASKHQSDHFLLSYRTR